MSLLLFRLGCGLLLFLTHGLPNAILAWNFLWKGQPWDLFEKLKSLDYPFPVVLATAGSVVCAVLPLGLILGFLTRLSAIGIILVLLIGLAINARIGDALQQELLLLYILALGLLALQGGGVYGLDTLFRRKRRSRMTL